jgi:hypothetical protein
MKVPFYVRPEDYRYCLRSNGEYGWATGITEEGLQVLRPRLAACWLIFDGEGALVRVIDEAVRYRECPIGVKRFWFPDRWLGIEDLPEELSEFYTAPDEYVMNPGDVEAWVGAGQFMFYPGAGDYIMSRDGKVEAD